jgi:BRCA1/BRCA2-containing complex subunit 3
LLLGRIEGTEVFIYRSLVLSRKDKKKDRVEVGYEQLAITSTIAERLSIINENHQQIVGWYHSHPHITAMPSHVDVRTQGNYQQLDLGFVGLIFSVFDNGRLDICAFQSRGEGPRIEDCQWSRVEIPISIAPRKFTLTASQLSISQPPRSTEGLISLQQILISEEMEQVSSLARHCSSAGLPHTLSIYQGILLRLVDQQLRPTLLALKSRSASLQRELDELRRTKASSTVPPPLTPLTPPLTPYISQALSVLEPLCPQWNKNIRALRLAKSGLLVCPISPPPPLIAHNQSLHIIPTPHTLVSPPHTNSSRYTPWSIQFGLNPSLVFPFVQIICPSTSGSTLDDLITFVSAPESQSNPPLSTVPLLSSTPSPSCIRYDGNITVRLIEPLTLIKSDSISHLEEVAGVMRIVKEDLANALRLDVTSSCNEGLVGGDVYIVDG